MKRLITWIGTIVLTLVVLDVALGLSFKYYMAHRGLPGDYEAIDYILHRNDNDILVLGSSVGLNSLNTKAIEDSLGIKTFNASANGQTLPFFVSMLKGIVNEKHKPKLIVLCLTLSNLTTTGLGDRYNFLAPYYGESIGDIDERLEELSPMESVFLKSNAYRLNTIWFRIFLYNFFSAGIKGENGYIGKPVPSVFPSKVRYPQESISDERYSEMSEFLSICRDNDIDLMIFLTPLYTDDDNTREVERLRKQAEEFGAKVYNDVLIKPISSDSTLFYDHVHLNIEGTKTYTPIAIERIRNEISKK